MFETIFGSIAVGIMAVVLGYVCGDMFATIPDDNFCLLLGEWIE